MRQIVAILGVMVVLSGVAASGASADPSDLKLRIDGQAQFLSPTAVLLPVTYDCPAGSGTAALAAGVFQGEEQAAFMELPADVPCTGKWETIVLLLLSPDPAFAIEPGPARASASMFHAAGSEGKERKVHIVA